MLMRPGTVCFLVLTMEQWREEAVEGGQETCPSCGLSVKRAARFTPVQWLQAGWLLPYEADSMIFRESQGCYKQEHGPT